MDFEAIKKAAQAYGPDMTHFLRDMIAIPSESCEEKGVAHLSARHMAVFDGDDGMLRMLGAHVVDHHLTVAAKRRRNPLCDLFECFQRCGFYGLSLLCLPAAVCCASCTSFQHRQRDLSFL